MKTGILTFHRAINYGAILQAYALSTTIGNLGVEAEFIDYIAPFVAKRHHLLKPSISPLSMYRYLRYGRTVNERFSNFQEFLERMTLSNSVSSQVQLIKATQNLDAVICGSDQVWNTELTNKDFHFFLDFVPDNVKKISYAASFGFTHIPSDQRNVIKHYLERFNSISVREEAGADIVERLTGKRPQITLDPTLLLSADKWREISITEDLPSNYILVYSVGEIEKLFPLATRICHYMGLPIVIISHCTFRELKNAFYLRSAGPSGFLDAFDRAEGIITNSFHGTAFSVIFRKKFLVLPRTVDISKGSGINSRIDTLLRHADLEKQIYKDGDPVDALMNTDYSVANGKLNILRAQSINFLREALQ